MKLLKWLIPFLLCGFVSSAVLEKETSAAQTGGVKTNFVSALEIKEMEKDSEENAMEHKLKMSVMNKSDPESSPKSVVYLLKDKELKGFLRTLPIEMLRKLRTLASRDIQSAQNFLVKLVKERKRNGILENTERTGNLDSEAEPLISSRNFSRSFIFNNSSLDAENISSKNLYSRNGFLSDYKFRPDSYNSENARGSEMDRDSFRSQSESQWAVATPPPQRENTSTVTYIVHEVVYPKYSTEAPVPSTTENHRSLQQPIPNPLPTFPAFVKSPSYNYKPTVLRPVNTISKQKIALMDNYYGASRHVKGLNQQRGQMGSGSENMNQNQNPTLLLPHLPAISPEYGWGIANVPSTHSFDSPMYDMESVRGPVEYEKQELDNAMYFDGGSNMKNTDDAMKVFLPNNPQHITEHSFMINHGNHGNQPNYNIHPSPSSYYTMKPVNNYQNPGSHSSTKNSNNIHHQQDNSAPSQFHGWTDASEGDYQYKGLWSRAKSYFYKGDRSTAEKVFEISLGILAFLAFGGYICMLVYQVIAVSATAPLFPLVTQAIPANPTLFGILFGRSFNSAKGRSVLDAYLDKIEKKVKMSIKKFREELGDKVKEL